jgi:gamma-glutamyltranspeptidase/glutathione hydrolase
LLPPELPDALPCLLLALSCLAFAAGPADAGAQKASPVARSQGGPVSDSPSELPVSEERSPYGMVAAGVPEASQAGARILEQGGNAVDAAVATAFAAGVVDPINAGLGGQCYVLIHLRDGRDVAIDGSAPVPLRVVPDEIRPLKESGFLWGYKLVATPATPAALAYTLRRYGTMSLAQVLAPAIELAEYGHQLKPSIASVVDHYADRIRENEFLARTFLKDGLDRFPPDHIYCQPRLAETLRRLATHGVEEFYSGSIAEEIVADMAANGGYVSKLDLALLHVTERVPVRGRYRGLEVVAFPYPGGGEILVEALQILDVFPSELLRQDSVDRSHLLLDAVRIAFQDAPTGAGTPLLATAFLDPARAGRRAALIRFDRVLREEELPVSQDVWFHDRDTTHVSVVDRFGNAVALTQTLGYGGFVATPALGFEYNSLLESCDFCNRGSPNSPVPLRTLRTTMTPSLLLCSGKPLLVLGGAGSSRIPSMIVAVVTNVVDRAMPLREAVISPRVLANRSNPERHTKGCRSAPIDPPPEEKIYIEATNPIASRQADALYVRGFSDQRRLTSAHTMYDWRAFGGVNAVIVDPSTGILIGVGDPRRNGGAAAPNPPRGRAQRKEPHSREPT